MPVLGKGCKWITSVRLKNLPAKDREPLFFDQECATCQVKLIAGLASQGSELALLWCESLGISRVAHHHGDAGLHSLPAPARTRLRIRSPSRLSDHHRKSAYEGSAAR